MLILRIHSRAMVHSNSKVILINHAVKACIAIKFIYISNMHYEMYIFTMVSLMVDKV